MKATYIAVVAIFILDYINCEEARVRSVLKPVEGNEVASESNSKVLKSFRFVDMIPTDRVHGRKKIPLLQK